METEDCYSYHNTGNILKKLRLLNRSDVLKFRDIRTWIAEQTGIPKNTSKYEKLKEFLSYLFFDAGDQKPKGRKLKAIIAGSFAASKARNVKKYRDIDIWILWDPEPCYCQACYGTKYIFECKYRWLNLINFISKDINYDYTGIIPGLIKIITTGKVQFLLLQYDRNEFPSACLCDYHITNCFSTTHNVTRYRLLIIEDYRLQGESRKMDFGIPCYIPFNKHVLAKETAINSIQDTLYPSKHLTNSPSVSPPTLFYQALLVLLKM